MLVTSGNRAAVSKVQQLEAVIQQSARLLSQCDAGWADVYVGFRQNLPFGHSLVNVRKVPMSVVTAAHQSRMNEWQVSESGRVRLNG